MPFEIEYDIGIKIIQMNAGIDSEKLSSSIFLIGSSISKPTIINTGAVAAGGIERNSGERNRVTAKQQATTNAVRPVRPPWDMPDALSTKVVVVDVPSIAPTVVAIASAIKACLRW